MKFWITVSTNGVSTRLCHKWNNLYLFCFRFGYAWLWWAGKFLQKRRWIYFFVIATRLSCKTRCSVTAKQHNCRCFVLKREMQNVAAGFALFTVVETSRFDGWNVNTLFISTCWTIHIFNSLSYFVAHTEFFFFYIWLVEMGQKLTIVCWVPSLTFFSKEKASFVCSSCLYVLL